MKNILYKNCIFLNEGIFDKFKEKRKLLDTLKEKAFIESKKEAIIFSKTILKDFESVLNDYKRKIVIKYDMNLSKINMEYYGCNENSINNKLADDNYSFPPFYTCNLKLCFILCYEKYTDFNDDKESNIFDKYSSEIDKYIKKYSDNLFNIDLDGDHDENLTNNVVYFVIDFEGKYLDILNKLKKENNIK